MNKTIKLFCLNSSTAYVPADMTLLCQYIRASGFNGNPHDYSRTNLRTSGTLAIEGTGSIEVHFSMIFIKNDIRSCVLHMCSTAAHPLRAPRSSLGYKKFDIIPVQVEGGGVLLSTTCSSNRFLLPHPPYNSVQSETR